MIPGAKVTEPSYLNFNEPQTAHDKLALNQITSVFQPKPKVFSHVANVLHKAVLANVCLCVSL